MGLPPCIPTISKSGTLSLFSRIQITSKSLRRRRGRHARAKEIHRHDVQVFPEHGLFVRPPIDRDTAILPNAGDAATGTGLDDGFDYLAFFEGEFRGHGVASLGPTNSDGGVKMSMPMGFHI